MTLHATPAVHKTLRDGSGLLRTLERYCPVEWRAVVPGADVSLADGLSCRAFDVPTTKRDRFGTGTGPRPGRGLPADRRAQRRDAGVPAGRAGADAGRARRDRGLRLPAGRRHLLARRRAGPARPGRQDRPARWATCPSTARTAASRSSPRSAIDRTIYIHMNNTNPILLDDSPERRIVAGQRHGGGRGRARGRGVERMTTTSPRTDSFVEALRAHSQRYHDQHPFHLRMNAGRLSRRQLQGWVANRFYYQENIPRKDAAILSNCPDLEVRRRWIRRIVDHDGTAAGRGRHRGVAAPRRGRRADPRGGPGPPAPGPRRAVRRRRLRDLRPDPAVGGGGGVVAHRAVRPRPDGRAAGRVRALLPVDRPGRASPTSAPASSRPRATASTPSRWSPRTA